MHAEIIAIGTELLLGATVDTNSAYLAQQLATIGVAVRRVTLVRDEMDEMVELIRTAAGRADLVICSGGLGPTGDDLTREAIAVALDQPLEFHQVLLDDIAARFAANKRTMSPSNRQQAYVPQDAYIIRNPRGTAPAFVSERDGHLVAALPGVPSELEYLTENALLPYLRDHHGMRDVIVVREVRVAGLPESVAGEHIAEMMNLANPVVGITAKRGQHTIRIAATASSRAEAEALIAPLVATIEQRFGEHLVGDETLEQQVARLLAEQDIALLLHETLTYAPVFRALAAVPNGEAAIARGALIVRASEARQPLDQASLEQTASALLREQTPVHGHAVALLAIAGIRETVGEYTPVHFVVTNGDRALYATRGFDLNIGAGYDLVAGGALDLLRRWLLGEGTAIAGARE
jgi:competence/damage-inducible protein CinA-like protein